ncbi:MAG: putative coat protein [Pepevirus faecivicinum]|uniref:Coat protein n=1 Tax=Leviviridae sp. TaxID=2027243 RepID=A0ABY3SU70_9VIRU|nr:MAG: putative coat protein [Leviviridae sp.]
MPKSIALSVGDDTYTFTQDRTLPNGEEVFTVKSGPLLGRMRLRARLAPNAAGTVNRVRLVLDVPKVVDGDPAQAGIQPKVEFTQVWSSDCTVVLASDSPDRDLLAGLAGALTVNPSVVAMITDGSNLSN